MASTRVSASILLRTARAAIVRTSRPAPHRLHVQQTKLGSGAPSWAITQARWQSQDAKSAAEEGTTKFYSFEQVQELISKPSKDRILVDAREPAELQESGRIPSAVNIPVTTSPDAFFLSEEEFEDKFGFERPSKDKEVIFYCKAGVRSRAAAQLARQAGWEKAAEYQGSWLDWAGKGGKIER